MNSAGSVHLCPICHTPAATISGSFACWNNHEPAFWHKYPRRELAARLGCTGPRVSQLITMFGGGKRKQYTWEK